MAHSQALLSLLHRPQHQSNKRPSRRIRPKASVVSRNEQSKTTSIVQTKYMAGLNPSRIPSPEAVSFDAAARERGSGSEDAPRIGWKGHPTGTYGQVGFGRCGSCPSSFDISFSEPVD